MKPDNKDLDPVLIELANIKVPTTKLLLPLIVIGALCIIIFSKLSNQ